MSSKEDIKPITYMKTKSADLIKQVKKNRRPVFISQNGELQVVVQDLDEYQRQKDLLLLLRTIAIGEKEVRGDSLISQDALFAELDKKLSKSNQYREIPQSLLTKTG